MYLQYIKICLEPGPRSLAPGRGKGGSLRVRRGREGNTGGARLGRLSIKAGWSNQRGISGSRELERERMTGRGVGEAPRRGRIPLPPLMRLVDRGGKPEYQRYCGNKRGTP